MIKYHHEFPIYHMYTGITMTIQIEYIPFTLRFFRIAILNAMSSYFACRTESVHLPGGIENIFAIRLFNNRNVFHAAGYPPVVPAISFFDLEFLGTHPG